ncbi:hypothetical protein BT67DRAFT_274380 [Trichocladium antarcticum]|uniref:Uncharacterized protein n=1 Tax=Trichocladium antarcticum TaxID=1450529 RepID=A0AAN6UM33_9PEZI|nr:hypothetical protein BT67DRAFT_274380 [Trichocladium antarcticum]
MNIVIGTHRGTVGLSGVGFGRLWSCSPGRTGQVESLARPRDARVSWRAVAARLWGRSDKRKRRLPDGKPRLLCIFGSSVFFCLVVLRQRQAQIRWY